MRQDGRRVRGVDVRFPDPATLALYAERRASTLAVLRGLGEAAVGELADAMGVRDPHERRVLRSRLCSWEQQGYVRREIVNARRTVWRVV